MVFEQAWEIMKAPLDFDSIRDVGVVEEGGFPYRRFEADFIDPETQERLPAFARLSDDGIGVGRIKDPDPEAYPSERAFHMIHPYGKKGIYPYSIQTDIGFRGRGYQEALFHLIMRLAEAQDKKMFEPSSSMKTGDGNMFARRMREKHNDPNINVDMIKSPIDVFSQGGAFRVIGDDEMLFSGGDVRDSPRYYSTNLDAALHYALYGSAVPYADIKGKRDDKGQSRPSLRTTVPSISTIDPRHYSNYDDEGMYDSSLSPIMMEDPFSPGFGVIDDEGGSGDRLSNDEVIELLESYINEERYRGAMGGTTGELFTTKERAKHANSALKRLIAYRDNESLERFNPNAPTYEMKGNDVFRTTEYDDFVDTLGWDELPFFIHGEWDSLTDWQKEAAEEAGYGREVWNYD